MPRMLAETLSIELQPKTQASVSLKWRTPMVTFTTNECVSRTTSSTVQNKLPVLKMAYPCVCVWYTLIHVCVSTCTCIYVCPHVFVYVEAKGQFQVSSLRQQLSLVPDITNGLAWLASKLLVSFRLCSSSVRVTDVSCHSWFFHTGTKRSNLRSWRIHSTWQNHLLVQRKKKNHPKPHLFKNSRGEQPIFQGWLA